MTGGTIAGGSSSNPGYARYSSPIKAQPQQNFGNFSSSDPYGQPVQGQMGGGGGQQGGGSFGDFGGFGFGGQQGGGQNLLNDHTAQMGVHLGRQMAQAGGEYMEKNVSTE